MPLWKPESAAFSGAHLRRYRQIAATLIRYGFGDIVERLHLEPYVAWGRRLLGGKRYHPQEIPPLAERLRLACEELGPTFIKLAQILSTRPDLIPLSIARELARLQDTATPFASAEAKRIVEEELGVPLARVFEEFADRPLAAASIAQVHRARLVTGEDVAVKIQRPGIAETIAIDLTILYHLASLLERYGEEISFYRPTLIVEEFARTVTKELTFLVEAAHAERFARLLSQRPDVQVPQIVRRATTNRVLTMTFMEGIKITDLEGLTKAGYDRKRIADRGAEIFLEQIFIHGYFHADPHPGNLLVLPGEVICFLDFGMMGSLDKETRQHFTEILIAFMRGDASEVTAAMLNVAEWEREPDRQRLTEDIATFMDIHLYRPLSQFRVTEALRDILEITYRHRFHLPPMYILILKVLSQLEGIGRTLDPDFDLPTRLQPFVLRLGGRGIWGKLGEETLTLGRHLLGLPEEFSRTLNAFREGKVTVTVIRQDNEGTATDPGRATNRLSLAILVAAILITSSLFLVAAIGPLYGGYSLWGLVGLEISAVLAVLLIGSLFRSGLF